MKSSITRFPTCCCWRITLPLSRWIGTVDAARDRRGGGGGDCRVGLRADGQGAFCLDLRLTRFLRVVIVPGLAPYVVAGLLAWPVAQLVAETSRWQGAGVLLVVGMLYAAAVIAVLHCWVLTDEEKQKGVRVVRAGFWEFSAAREATA